MFTNTWIIKQVILNWMDYLFEQASNLRFLPTTTIQILFYILIETKKMLFKELQEQLQDIMAKSVHEDGREEITLELDDWRRRYETVCRFADEINNNFGFMLLTNLSWIFSKSIENFRETMFTYAFLVISVFVFDLDRTMKNFLYLKMNEISMDLSDHEIFLNPKYAKSLRMFVTQKEMFTLIPHILGFIQIWFRLLIIVIPASRAHAEVNKKIVVTLLSLLKFYIREKLYLIC